MRADPCHCYMSSHYLSHPKLQRILTVICILAVVVHGVILVYLRPPHDRDFDLHRLMGTWFLTDQNLYSGGICYPYMPVAAMYFSLLALTSRAIGFAFRYMTAIGCLLLTCALFHRMIKAQFQDVAHSNLLLGVITVALAGQFLLYDLDDGGPHTILLGLMMGGVYAVWTGGEKLGAVIIGLAIALKVTPVLFLPFFLWKRQWKLALYTTVAAICWILLPIVWMGPSSWWSHQLTWTQVAAGSLIGAPNRYTQINEDNIRNSGINPALMRYLVTLPPEHALRKDDPGYVPIFNVPVVYARVIVVAAIAMLVGLFGWQTRRPYQGSGDHEWPRECSMLLIIMLLLSPLTWIQHLPWLLPALYWVVARAWSKDGLGPWGKGALGIYIMVAMVLNYELLGKQNFNVFLSYKPFTIGMVMILAIVMTQSRNVGGLSHR